MSPGLVQNPELVTIPADRGAGVLQLKHLECEAEQRETKTHPRAARRKPQLDTFNEGFSKIIYWNPYSYQLKTGGVLLQSDFTCTEKCLETFCEPGGEVSRWSTSQRPQYILWGLWRCPPTLRGGRVTPSSSLLLARVPAPRPPPKLFFQGCTFSWSRLGVEDKGWGDTEGPGPSRERAASADKVAFSSTIPSPPKATKTAQHPLPWLGGLLCSPRNRRPQGFSSNGSGSQYMSTCHHSHTHTQMGHTQTSVQNHTLLTDFHAYTQMKVRLKCSHPQCTWTLSEDSKEDTFLYSHHIHMCVRAHTHTFPHIQVGPS